MRYKLVLSIVFTRRRIKPGQSCPARARHGRRFVAVGNGLPDNAGLNVLFKGQFVENKKFGRQLAVERWEEIIPKTTDGIREYLYVAKIKHIGKVTADKIVAMYGERSLEMLEDATALSRVNGISMTKAVGDRGGL